MVMNQQMLGMASWPALAISDGVRFSFIASGFHLICHPCHLFQESVLNSNTKEFSEFNGKGDNSPVHGVLRKIDFSMQSEPIIKVLTDV